jgi:hypothetical protein
MPPSASRSSKIVTSWPFSASWYAHDSPAGPPPITATLLPLRSAGALNFRPLPIAHSPR